MKAGARNRITGKVEKIRKGQVMGLATVRVQGPVEITSVMTVDSMKDMGLKKGDRVTVLVKAVSVLLVKE